MIRHHDDLVRSMEQVRDGRLSRRAFLGAAVAAGFSASIAERLLNHGANWQRRPGRSPARMSRRRAVR